MTTLVTPLGATTPITASTAPAMGTINVYDATSGNLTPTLPALSGLNVGASLGIQKAIGDVSTNTITFTTTGADTFQGGATTEVLRLSGEQRKLQVVSISSTKYWKVIGGNIPVTAGLDTRYAQLPVALASFASLAGLSVIGNATPSSAIPTAIPLASTATPSTIAYRDSNANLAVNALVQGAATSATAAGTTNLTAASPHLQQFTGTTTQNVILPNATTLSVGHAFTVTNRSTGAVTLKASGGSTLQVMVGDSQATARLLDNSVAAGTWDVSYGITAAAPATSGTGILKGDGSGGTATATAGTDYAGIGTTQTLTATRVNPRTVSVAQSATPAVNVDTTDVAVITGLAQAITSMSTNLTGTPVDGQRLIFRITGTAARAITWGTSFTGGAVTPLATTATTKTHIVQFLYDSGVGKWVCITSDATGY